MQKVTILLFLAVFLAFPAYSAEPAPPPGVPGERYVSLQISALQQRFMVAALSCGKKARESYNHFQQLWKPALLRSDAIMLQTFRRLFGQNGDNAYNRFKTRLAAKAELRRIQDSPRYCRSAAEGFQALEQVREVQDREGKLQTLSRFAAGHIRPAFSWPIAALPAAPAP